MSPRLFITAFFSILFSTIKAQYIVSGAVSDTKSQPLIGVSISVKDSYEGTSSDSSGKFRFEVSDTGKITLQFSFQGYKSVEKIVQIPRESILPSIFMKEEITEMKAVVVSAGVFEASDKKRSTVLKSVDMVTTAGQQADIVATLKTLPGAQQIGDQEGLFIRGGTGNETKVYIDGMMVTNPFFSSVPGIAQRSRFSPLLFKGTVFSSGGYSAQYGQGLSSVLLLESIDLPSRSEINLILSSAQQSIMGQRLNKSKNSSVGFNVNYTNLAPYFSVVKQKYDYTKSPEVINAELSFRSKWKNGIFKWYSYANYNVLGFEKPSLDFSGLQESFHIRNRHLFSIASLNLKLKGQWQLYNGAAFSMNRDRIRMNTNPYFSFQPDLSNETIQLRTVFTKNFPGLTKLYLGAEQQYIRDGIEAIDSINKRQVRDYFSSLFVESDIFYSTRLVSKAGVRYEYSSLLGKMKVSPRLSLAYKLNDRAQVSVAYGVFYQKPETNYLLRKPELDFTKASHYILNFQRIHNGQTFRTELFYKKYDRLITVGDTPFDISNQGHGYARGVEIFWRDKTSIENLDYWISYSFLDTKRKFLNYPHLAHPSFAAKHTFNAVAKRYFPSISTQFSATYSFASGRPWFNPNKSEKEFMQDKTREYQSLGLQANYLRSFGKVNAVFIVNIGNVLGTKQVYGYRFAQHPDARGNYNSEAITPMAKRFIFIGTYLSIGSDRRKQILD